MADKQVMQWIGDQLYDLVGLNERLIVQFLVDMAVSAKDPNDLLRQLLLSESLPDNDKARTFTEELFKRVSRKEKTSNGEGKRRAREQEDAAVAMIEKNASYAILDDSEGEADEKTRKKIKKAKKKDRREREKHMRSTDNADSDDGDGVNRAYLEQRHRERVHDEVVDSKAKALELEETQRDKDVEERDAFAERLRNKDKARTRNMVEGKGSTNSSIDAVRRRQTQEEADKKNILPELRKQAREKYLKERKDRKLEELRDDIADEEYLFDQSKLSKRELKELQYKKEIYSLASEHVKARDKGDVDRYAMPQSYVTEQDGKYIKDSDIQKKLLTARYQDVLPDEQGPGSEQKGWEEEQLKHATLKVGARDRKSDAPEYEYVFEDTIDFVLTDKMSGEREQDAEENVVSEHDKKVMSLQEVRNSLPVFPYREDFVQAVRDHQVLIIVGETGSGKTTQLPQYLYEEGFCDEGKTIGCTQPRRVAAMSVAARVADEMDVKLGHEVGYSIRFEDCTTEKTKLKYMTDGMLLREFMSEPDLGSYSVMMIDEAHERTLHTDILFGLIKDIARFRPDIRILVSSATLQAEKFSEYFDDAPIFNIPGRRFPVDVFYTKQPEADYLDACVVTVLQIHLTQEKGDILVFLTGQDDIEACAEALTERVRKLGSRIGELLVLPIYASLPPDLQARIFEPTPEGARKVVIATNIAETSLTIDGIIYVIDPGFCKQNSYNPRTGMESLIVTPISKASANQRSGRAGRVAAGKAFRLFTAWAYKNELEESTIPEIQRTNLSFVVLLLKSLGINDLVHFDFMDPPPAETLIRALEQMYALGAINARGELTKLGRKMAEFPVEPMLAKALIASEEYKCSEEIMSIVAMLSAGSTIFYRPKDKAIHADTARTNFNSPGGDHMTLLNVWKQWEESGFSIPWCFENFIQHRTMKRARDVREQLQGLMERVEIESTTTEDSIPIRKAFTSGFFYNTARLTRAGNYKTIKHQQAVYIHPSSDMAEQLPRWVIYHELVFTSKEYMRNVIEIKAEWLAEVAPHYYKAKELADDNSKKMPKSKASHTSVLQ
eukprot:CFRG4513T1